jgi:tRNA dimethylallyltransferase
VAWSDALAVARSGEGMPATARPGEGVLLLAGPTCSGKSALAVELAERFDGEIVGADSRQIYRDMPIGTAAPTAEQRARVPHHLVGFLDPLECYSAARYAADALAAVIAIRERGKRALVVGGTGFYLRALAGDVALSAAYDPVLRARLAREVRLHPPEVLHAWLASRAPVRAAAISERDPYRITRALEIALAGVGGGGNATLGAGAIERDGIMSRSPADGRVTPHAPAEAWLAPQSLREARIPYLKIVIDVPQHVLDERIEHRVDEMLAAGLIAEAERVGAAATASDAVGYPEALAYLAGYLSPRELRSLLIRSTRRYAKRQRTWFRSEPGVVYAPPEGLASLVTSDLHWRPH